MINMNEMFEKIKSFLLEKKAIVHPILYNKFTMAATNGDRLYTLKKCKYYWNKMPEFIKYNYENEMNEKGLFGFHIDFLRFFYNSKFSWYLPNQEFIKTFEKYCHKKTPILEIGSGTGYIAKVLSWYRKVIATDIDENLIYRDEWNINIKNIPCEKSIIKYKNQNPLILAIYPYEHMLINILNLSQVNQLIAIIIPPYMGITDNCINFILDKNNFQLIDLFYDFAIDFETTRCNWNGVLIRKIKDFNSCYDIVVSGNKEYNSWLDITKLYKQYNKLSLISEKLPFTNCSLDKLMSFPVEYIQQNFFNK